MAKIVTRNREVLYVQPNGNGTGLSPISINRHGKEDATDNTVPQRGILYGRDEFGRPVSKVEFDNPPGGLVVFNLPFDKVSTVEFLDKARIYQNEFAIYNFFIPAGRINNYVNWVLKGRLEYYARCKVTQPTYGAGPAKDYDGQPVVNTYQITSAKLLILTPPALASLTNAETRAFNDIAGIPDLDPNHEIPGYPGADKILVAATDGDTGITANVQISVDGGSIWTPLAADPFAAAENHKAISIKFISPTKYRIVVLRDTANAGQPPRVSWTDITVGDEAATPTWTPANLGATNNQAGEAFYWEVFDRAFGAAAGDIYVSTNQGESFTALLTGATAINQITKDYEDNHWFVGASNLIMREKADSLGTIETLVGPSGGGAMTAIAVARDGAIYVGNGTALYRSNNSAINTSGWDSLKDFGANHSVKRIQCVDGESQLIRVLVSDATGTDGDLWYSLDGANTSTEVTNLTNLGYNAAYFSPVDPNFLVIAGEVSGGFGVLHKLTSA